MKRLLTALSLLLVLVGLRTSPASARPDLDAVVQRHFKSLEDRYFDDYLARNPSTATSLGIHRYDAKLEDYTRAGIEANVAAQRRFLAELERIDRRRLTPYERGDYDLLLNCGIQSTILELDGIRAWRHNADNYTSGASNAIFVIMARRFDTEEKRLALVIARERLIPAVFVAARANLVNPPRIFTQIAMEQIPGVIDFFKNDVPSAFSQVKGTRRSWRDSTPPTRP